MREIELYTREKKCIKADEPFSQECYCSEGLREAGTHKSAQEVCTQRGFMGDNKERVVT